MTASNGLSRRSDDVLCTAVTAPVVAPRSVPPEELLGGVAGVDAQARGDHRPVSASSPVTRARRSSRSSYLRLNPHLHIIVLDGTWREQDGELAWEGLGHLRTSQVGEVLEGVIRRIERTFAGAACSGPLRRRRSRMGRATLKATLPPRRSRARRRPPGRSGFESPRAPRAAPARLRQATARRSMGSGSHIWNKECEFGQGREACALSSSVGRPQGDQNSARAKGSFIGLFQALGGQPLIPAAFLVGSAEARSATGARAGIERQYVSVLDELLAGRAPILAPEHQVADAERQQPCDAR
jgi:hypothetical protein